MIDKFNQFGDGSCNGNIIFPFNFAHMDLKASSVQVAGRMQY